ncbi:MAG: hypothetical protein K9M82_05715 [Deltaproteobacteria bacterium]|nr:hypothetical protein [Deltaproteobacteria bacterium]
MEGYVKVATLDNEIEALLLESVLEERGTPYALRSYHDTAYDGLFQAQKGWGVVTAPQEHRDEILEILDDLRKSRDAREGTPD